MKAKSDFAKRLATLRKRAGLTQEALGDKAGMSARAIQDYERDINTPTIKTLEAMAGALGVPIAEFFGVDSGGRVPARYAGTKGLNQSLRQEVLHRRAEEEREMAGMPVLKVEHSAIEATPLIDWSAIKSAVDALSLFQNLSPERRDAICYLATFDARYLERYSDPSQVLKLVHSMLSLSRE